MPKLGGDSYKDILLYWAPELVSVTVLTALPMLIDAYLISLLRSTTAYGALGAANTFLHTLIKLAECPHVAAIAVIGKYNGALAYKKAGRALGDAFWTSLFSGLIPAAFIFFFSTEIFYYFLHVPHNMALLGSPFLRLRAIGVALAFAFMALIGFLRGVKNTRTPMIIFITGQLAFLLTDYLLILGRGGFPCLGLMGSAIATIVQYSIMLIMSMVYIIMNPAYKKYFTQTFFYFFNVKGALRILNLSWQIAIDKTAISFSYVQLLAMISPMGKYAIASFNVIKDLQRLAILPALAFASVITFLVSNRLGAKDPAGALQSIVRTFKLAAFFTVFILLVMCINPTFFVCIFDLKNKFTPLASLLFPIISIFAVLDFIQLILSAALRGAGDVRTVMLVRATVCGAFLPLGWYISKAPIQNEPFKFFLIYALFYVANGIMALLLFARMKTKRLEIPSG